MQLSYIHLALFEAFGLGNQMVGALAL